MIEVGDIAAAATRIGSHAIVTPVVEDAITPSGSATVRLFMKCENRQRTGSFKFRGAFNTARSLDPGARARGLVAYSSGNHAQAVAAAARILDVPALVLMPFDAPEEKRHATEALGAEVLGYDRYQEDREALAAALVEDRKMTLIPPYDHALVMAGQGTAALELIELVGALDSLIVPVGGGGLIAGCSVAAAGRSPGIRIVGVEPRLGDDVRRSLAAGRRIELDVPDTIADGQQIRTPGRLTFEVILSMVHDVVGVGDPEIAFAMEWMRRRHGVTLEPSGASALAAVLFDLVPRMGTRVGVILSGGNIGEARYSSIMNRYLHQAVPPQGVDQSPSSLQGEGGSKER